MSDNVIALNRNYAPFVEDEYPAGESDIEAGHFLEVNASDKVIKHSSEMAVGTTGPGLGIIANVNKSDPDQDKDDAYDSDENVHILHVPIGGKVDAKLAAGGDLDASADANVSKWDVLEEADNGALKNHTGWDVDPTATTTETVPEAGALYMALEANDNSAAAAGVANQVLIQVVRVA